MEYDHIELNTFIRVLKIVNTGGKAKLLIRSKGVKVNGEVEMRNRKKLLAGDKVMINGLEYVVQKEVLRNR